MCLGIVSQYGGGQFCFYLPAAGCWMNAVIATRYSQSKAGMVISALTNPSLAAGTTRCWYQEILSQIQLSSWMHHYPSLVVQTARMTTVVLYVGSSTSGSRFIVFIITITHLLAFQALITAIITPGLMPSSAIDIGVSPTATGAGD